MVILKLQGGLGNQLFQYAAYLKLQERFDECYLDVSDYNLPKDNGYRKYLLGYFNTNMKMLSFGSITRRIRLSFSQYKNTMQVFNLNIKKNMKYIDWKRASTLSFDLKEVTDNSYIEGYFSNEDFFPYNFKDLFYLKDTKCFDSKILEKIRRSQSVSIHVRRGDYLIESRYWDICTTNYYNNGISYIENCIDKPVFFFFSDDIEWVKLNFEKKENFIYVQMENDSNNSTIRDLFYMSQCKHNIIANSTFSWWGAWLNKNKSKIVIRPKWFANDSKKSDIFPTTWIRVD